MTAPATYAPYRFLCGHVIQRPIETAEIVACPKEGVAMARVQEVRSDGYSLSASFYPFHA